MVEFAFLNSNLWAICLASIFEHDFRESLRRDSPMGARDFTRPMRAKPQPIFHQERRGELPFRQWNLGAKLADFNPQGWK